MTLSASLRWTLGLGIAALVTVVPFLYYRWAYTYSKRLREVVPGLVYRSGQMTADGFADTVARYHIRTVINFQDDVPDPDIRRSFFNPATVTEFQLCEELGVHYVFLPPDLIGRRQVPAHHPVAIDRFLDIMDDRANYPVLFHCRAGLHRTGVMAAVYRMEYQHWSPREAIRELKDNGFGEFPCNSSNDYITQYILTYRPRTESADGRQQADLGVQ